MNRIAVIGSPGCGKSYLAERLASRWALPLYRLDDLYWHPGWTRTPSDTWRRVVGELVRRDRWVIDGNYGSTLAARVEAAELVVFIDRRTLPCLATVLRRTVSWLLGGRAGLPARVSAGPPPARDLAHFLRVVVSFRRSTRPAMLRLLDATPHVRLTSRAAVDEFLAQVTHA